MDTLQKAMNRWLEELPHLLVADLLDDKLRAQGVKLSKRKRGELADKILNEQLEAFDFDDGRKVSGKRNITIQFTETDSEFIEKKFMKFMEHLPALIDHLMGKASQSVLSTLKRRWPSESQVRRRDLNGFRKRLQERWGDGLEKLCMLITIAREYGSELNKDAGRPRHWIAADVVRVADGMLAEHWDVLQDEATKAESRSGLPMFGTTFPE